MAKIELYVKVREGVKDTLGKLTSDLCEIAEQVVPGFTGGNVSTDAPQTCRVTLDSQVPLYDQSRLLKALRARGYGVISK
jgi:hypothetical protein